MRGFDLDQLRTFAAVADAGSLTAAAPLLHLSQSTVSEQVRKLESRAGVLLFVRSSAGRADAGRLAAAAACAAHRRAERGRVRRSARAGDQGRAARRDHRLLPDQRSRGPARAAAECYPQLSLHVSAMKSADIEARACARAGRSRRGDEPVERAVPAGVGRYALGGGASRCRGSHRPRSPSSCPSRCRSCCCRTTA